MSVAHFNLIYLGKTTQHYNSVRAPMWLNMIFSHNKIFNVMGVSNPVLHRDLNTVFMGNTPPPPNLFMKVIKTIVEVGWQQWE